MSKKDEILETLKSLAVAGLPLVLSPHGVALLTLANECFNSSGKLRQDKWNAEIASRIANLNAEMEQKIRETSNFASILASAQRGALEDMEEDKVALYANAVINAIKNEDIDNTKKHIFLNMLRDFTKLHIEILHKIADFIPQNRNMMNRFEIDDPESELLKTIIKQFPNNSFIPITIKELYDRNLINASHHIDMQVRGNVNNEQYYPSSITELGKEFLVFIAEQENAND